MSHFQDKTWPELKDYIDRNALIILPVGELEEHSLYLPVDTDARIATYLAAQIAEEIQDEIPVLVMPTVWSGYTCGAIAKWPGAMKLSPRVFTDMMHGICDSLAGMGFSKLFMLDCHGQHGPMLNTVTKLIADEYGFYYTIATPFTLSAPEFAKFRKSPRGGCSHAGEWEASMILHISPELVKKDQFTNVDALRHHSEFVSGDALMGGQKVVWSSFGIQSPKNGALGDPTEATAETGAAITRAVREAGGRFLREYYFHERIVIE